MKTCVDVIASSLRELGVERIFGIPGGSTVDFNEACRKSGLEFILTSHESIAAFMADVTGQITGIPGVCVSTFGPGATNLVNGVANAYLDRSPVLVFTSQVPTSVQPYVNHQYLALDELFKPITKKVFNITGKKTRRMIQEGFRIATTGPKGPVHFCLPGDIAMIEAAPSSEEPGPTREEDTTQSLNNALVSKSIEKIHEAQHPLIILGIGIDPVGDTENVRKFIKKNNFPVMSAPKAKGIFSEAEPRHLASVGGMMADDVVVDMIVKADFLIGIGFDPVESDKAWYNEIDILSINPYSIKYKKYSPTLEIIGDIKSTLDVIMMEDFSQHRWTDDEMTDFKQRFQDRLIPANVPLKGLFSPYKIIRKLREVLPENAVVTIDVGAHKCLVNQVWESYQPMTLLQSNGLSSMGYGLPSAMAAKLALPDKPVLCMTGDAGMAMVLPGLETAVRLGLSIVILVFCDECLSLIDLVQKQKNYPSYGVRFGKYNFASVAENFGARGVRISSLEELSTVVADGFNSDRPTVVEIPIDNTEYFQQM